MPDLYGGMDDVWIDLDDIWQAWEYLDPYRDSGFNMGLIPLHSQIDYMNEFGADDRERFLTMIRAIDVEYINAMQTEQAYTPDRDSVDSERLSQGIKAAFQQFKKAE